MTRNTLNPSSPIAPSSDASAVIAKAALSICCFSDKPSLRQEISDRLGLIKDALDCLEETTSEAAFHRSDLSYQGLYGAIRLIGREVKTINVLHDALYQSGEE